MVVADTHTEGEPTRIILSGFPKLKGDTLYEKRKFLQENLDNLRTSILLEPRGHDDQFGALILNTEKDDADYALIFMENRGYIDMCGHGTIGVSTALVDLGMVEPVEPFTSISYDTVAGPVKVKVKIQDGVVEAVSLVNVPSFYVGAFEVDLNGEKLPVDVAYGGNFYVIAKAEDLGTRVRREHIGDLIGLGTRLRDAANRQIGVKHPDKPGIPQEIGLAMITDEPELPISDGKNIVVFGNGQYDRSPCGTGTSARISTLYSKGLLKKEDSFIHESIINTNFKARILETTRVGPYDAIIPEVTGRAFITQMSHIFINSDDPLKDGFSMLQPKQSS